MKTKYLKSVLLLIFCSIISLQSYAQKKEWKLISYNVYWGMQKDSTENKSKFAAWIKAQDPDIVALQEMNGFTQQNPEFAPKGANPNNLQKFAESYGHPYVFIVREPAPDGSISFPVAITSKYPIVNVTRVVDNASHGFLTAEIEGMHFVVTHFHPFSSEKRGYEIDQILATIKSKPAGEKWLFMGDLNSVSPLDKSAYDDNKLRDFIREDRKKRPHNKNLGKDDELDYTIQQKILDFGFVDALKVTHPQFIASAPTKLFYDQSKFPLRYDYLYVSSNMKNDIVKCEIMKDDFTDYYSDHYPVLLIFKK
ncbi:endonuclease/exonuclease/phosphatase family protein [Dysgonomonas macrotermitis]|uniref:Exodeoxyribonuclease-3 n=1 Tax=Dysgonomonas macrotermitis TaxID=1346286 RepID=A0A1M4SS42_9BACT|nr:endonuclease/exonuclease/phosphatase family protein [Dysgonomonas macrotermitis]SHE34998.1 exodeoxyribonuclease-3 [Dysgonomonas macrotermitis]